MLARRVSKTFVLTGAMIAVMVAALTPASPAAPANQFTVAFAADPVSL